MACASRDDIQDLEVRSLPIEPQRSSSYGAINSEPGPSKPRPQWPSDEGQAAGPSGASGPVQGQPEAEKAEAHRSPGQEHRDSVNKQRKIHLLKCIGFYVLIWILLSYSVCIYFLLKLRMYELMFVYQYVGFALIVLLNFSFFRAYLAKQRLIPEEFMYPDMFNPNNRTEVTLNARHQERLRRRISYYLLRPRYSEGAENVEFCTPCSLIPPERTFHCEKCGRCIMRQFSHFGGVFGQCIFHQNFKFALLALIYHLVFAFISIMLLEYLKYHVSESETPFFSEFGFNPWTAVVVMELIHLILIVTSAVLSILAYREFCTKLANSVRVQEGTNNWLLGSSWDEEDAWKCFLPLRGKIADTNLVNGPRINPDLVPTPESDADNEKEYQRHAAEQAKAFMGPQSSPQQSGATGHTSLSSSM